MSKKVILAILVLMFILFSLDVFGVATPVNIGEACDNVNTACYSDSECYNGKCAYLDYGPNFLGFIDCGNGYSCTEDKMRCISQPGTTIKKCKNNYYCDLTGLGGAACYPKKLDDLSCTEDHMCVSNYCNKNTNTCQPQVLAKGKAGELCNEDWQCESGKCEDSGQGLFCASSDAGVFEKIKQFFSGFGKKKIVFLNTKQDGEICENNEECISNDCFGYPNEENRCRSDNYWIGSCGNAGKLCSQDGDKCLTLAGTNVIKTCGDNFYCKVQPNSLVCAPKLAVGESPCQNDYDCESNFCDRTTFTCNVKKETGDNCSIDSECASDACNEDLNVCIGSDYWVGTCGSLVSGWSCSSDGLSCLTSGELTQQQPGGGFTGPITGNVIGVGSPEPAQPIGTDLQIIDQESQQNVQQVICANGYYCNANGFVACVPQFNVGNDCTQDYQCLSGTCGDNGLCAAPEPIYGVKNIVCGLSDNYECSVDGSSCLPKNENLPLKVCDSENFCKVLSRDTLLVTTCMGKKLGYGGICAADYGCLSGDCENGLCGGCNSDSDCSIGSCNLDSGVCEITGFTGNCGAGYTCAGNANSNACVSESGDSSKLCADGYYCKYTKSISGFGSVFKKSFSSKSECVIKEPENANCNSDVECLSGTCENNLCTEILAECIINNDCGTDGLCESGTCYQLCEDETTCSENQVCSSGIIGNYEVCADDNNDDGTADVLEEGGDGGSGGGSGCLICPEGGNCDETPTYSYETNIKCCKGSCGISLYNPLGNSYLVDYSCNDINNDGVVERIYKICSDIYSNGKCDYNDPLVSVSQLQALGFDYTTSKGIDGYCTSEEPEAQPISGYGFIAIMLSIGFIALFYLSRRYRNTYI